MNFKILIVGLIALLFMTVPAMAVTNCNLDLVMKDPSDWTEVSGATGTLTYNSGSFTFTGSGLTDGSYTLINYAEPYPGTNNVVLGNGTASGGSISISGTMPTLYQTTDEAGKAKIWLVPTSDLTGNTFNTWNPTTYLFEENLIPVDTTVCAPTISDNEGINVTGSITQTLSITSSADIAFNEFIEGTNTLTNVGTITITSAFVPHWEVVASTSDGEGFMRSGAGAPVTGTPLKNELKQYNYLAGSPSWENANGLTFSGSSSKTMPESFSQLITVNDAPGSYSTVVTYTISAV
jgi:hypothetical protein